MHIIGWNLSILQAILSVIAFALLLYTDLLPHKYLIAVGAILVLLLVVPRLLMKWKIKNVRWWFGSVITVALCGVLIFTSSSLYTLANTLYKISGVSEKTVEVSVFVRADDTAETINDTADYEYGIMETVAREDADETIDLIEEELDSTLTVTTYEGLLDVADALLSGACDAIIFSSDYVDVIAELDDYDGFDDEVKELTAYSWVEEVVLEEDDEDEEDHTFIMYMSGIDTTGSVNVQSRSDVNILAVVNTETKQVLLLSTPRDYYVELSISNGAMDKLTHAGLYGVEVSVETLEMLYDTDIEYYFRINFTGFEDLIDALGGITVYSEYSFTATKGGYYYSVGWNTLNGAQALSFARERKAFSSGDIQRGKNQMAVIEAVIDKALSTSILTNFSSIMASVEDCFTTNMEYDTISALVKQQLADGAEWNIQTYSVSGTGSSKSTYSAGKAYVMLPDEETVETAKTYINMVLNGETLVVEEDED